MKDWNISLFLVGYVLMLWLSSCKSKKAGIKKYPHYPYIIEKYERPKN